MATALATRNGHDTGTGDTEWAEADTDGQGGTERGSGWADITSKRQEGGRSALVGTGQPYTPKVRED